MHCSWKIIPYLNTSKVFRIGEIHTYNSLQHYILLLSRLKSQVKAAEIKKISGESLLVYSKWFENTWKIFWVFWLGIQKYWHCTKSFTNSTLKELNFSVQEPLPVRKEWKLHVNHFTTFFISQFDLTRREPFSSLRKPILKNMIYDFYFYFLLMQQLCKSTFEMNEDKHTSSMNPHGLVQKTPRLALNRIHPWNRLSLFCETPRRLNARMQKNLSNPRFGRPKI